MLLLGSAVHAGSNGADFDSVRTALSLRVLGGR